MYNDQYGSKIEPDNVMVFAGGRCAIFTVLLFLKKNVQVRIGNAEWPAYLDIMTQAGIDWKTVQLDHSNNFHPPNSAYFDRDGLNAKTRVFPVISNPGNPTGTHIYPKFDGYAIVLTAGFLKLVQCQPKPNPEIQQFLNEGVRFNHS